MSKRKQPRPSRHSEDDDTEGQPNTNKKMSTAIDSEDVPPPADILEDGKKFPQVEEDAMISSEDEMSPEEHFEAERPLDPFGEDEEQNAIENVNGSSLKFHSREGSLEKDSDESPELEKESLSAALQNLMVDFQWPEGTSITIERVESTKVAVAELTAAAIQSSTSEYSAASLQDLALIQSTLFTLQQHQIVQLQLIQQLLGQLAVCTGELDSGQDSEPGSPLPPDMENGHEHPRRSRDERDKATVTKHEKRGSSSPEPPSGNLNGSKSASSTGETLSMKFASMLNCGNQDPNRPLSPGLASSYSLNSIMMPDGGSNEEVNTLEMLQKRAQEVLDSASQGLLSSSMVDENYKRTGILDKREPFFKHRCKYCGKVFGSDSALQIHIRSHTGERPFKCNVCGSRFTTKGNLKVHFQRHSMKFPHVKMNPHPVPEHLDHFHPPILSNGERSPELLPSSLPFGPLPPFQPVNFMRFDDHAAKLRMQLQEALEPEDLSKAKRIPMGKSSESSLPPRRSRSRSDNEEEDEDEDKDPPEIKPEMRKPRDDSKPRRKAESEGVEREEGEMDDIENDAQGMDIDNEDSSFNGVDQPENLSSKSLPLMHSLPLQASRPGRPSSVSKSSNKSSLRRGSQSPVKEEQPLSSGTIDELNLMELAKDPRAYAALLPRPGSASSAWESLIEVNTSSETSKLQQLVDNIDNQISDPNECVVCHRVLSCKSALQMHYRTHTGERPFKCRLCGRAFTTKGNLKTHMGVHRIKEGDTHHQCPVCHKRFTTQLVLQQHIRLHTGEPTDLTLDQIRAGEIRDFVPTFSQAAAANAAAISFLQQQQQQHNQQQQQQQAQLKSESSRDGGTPVTQDVKFSTSLAALENQVRTVTTFAGSHGIFPEDLSKKVGSGPGTPSAVPLPASSASRQSPVTTDSELSGSDWARQSESDYGTTPPSQAPSIPFLPLDLTPKNNIFSPFMPSLNPLMGNSALTSLANSVLNSTAAFNPVHMSVIAGRAGAARGNTTCSICLKTFACNSALEIHYRSHTKERPFKCTVCERGFSTKGNMKQHMLTHKIRDMPPTAFDGGKLSSQNSNSGDVSNMSLTTKPSAPSSAGSKGSSNEEPSPDARKEEEPPLALPLPPPPKSKDFEAEIKEPEPRHRHRRPESLPEHRHHEESRPTGHSNDDDSRHSFSSGGSKHMCPVCQKSFSSSSSLHIHMRTHTGDKPFKCSVCQKAFTTKGNLKVHMGTHMWTSGASRRGRRMSLELPLGLQFQPPSGDRVDGRFFPFVPPNFPGGPVNLAATKFGDYPIFRPPVPFPMMMPNNSMTPSERPAAKEEEEDAATETKEEEEEPPTP